MGDDRSVRRRQAGLLERVQNGFQGVVSNSVHFEPETTIASELHLVNDEAAAQYPRAVPRIPRSPLASLAQGTVRAETPIRLDPEPGLWWGYPLIARKMRPWFPRSSEPLERVGTDETSIDGTRASSFPDEKRAGDPRCRASRTELGP